MYNLFGPVNDARRRLALLVGSVEKCGCKKWTRFQLACRLPLESVQIFSTQNFQVGEDEPRKWPKTLSYQDKFFSTFFFLFKTNCAYISKVMTEHRGSETVTTPRQRSAFVQRGHWPSKTSPGNHFRSYLAQKHSNWVCFGGWLTSSLVPTLGARLAKSGANCSKVFKNDQRVAPWCPWCVSRLPIEWFDVTGSFSCKCCALRSGFFAQFEADTNRDYIIGGWCKKPDWPIFGGARDLIWGVKVDSLGLLVDFSLGSYSICVFS